MMEQFEDQFSMNADENTYEKYNEDIDVPIMFIRKVFLTFFLSLGVATIGCFYGLSSNVLPTVAKNYAGFTLLEFAVLGLTYLLRKKHGINLVMLCLFTFISGLTLSPMIHHYLQLGESLIIQEALILTLVIFFGLTAYAFITKKDFSYLNGFLFGALLGLIVIGIFACFFPLPHFVYLIYLYGGTLVFCLYILYDVSDMIHKRANDYILCALNLYLDFINLFIHILMILADSKKK